MLMQKRARFSIFIASILLPQAAAAIGSFFTMPSIPTWYAGLAKPSFNPPDWIFGPVWTILYLLMGIALALVWIKGTERKDVRWAMAFFGIQLALNVLWSFLFFHMHMPGAAFIEIILLWLAILITLLAFLRISISAGLLLIPYLFWVSYAVILNFFLWRLNI